MENLKPEGIYVKIVMPTAHASWAWLFSDKRGYGGVHLTSTLDRETQMLGCRKKTSYGTGLYRLRKINSQ